MLFDVIAAILAVVYTLRKLDAKRPSAQDYPAVAPERFAAWQRRELFALNLGSGACALKTLLGVFEYLYGPRIAAWAAPSGRVQWVYGVSALLFVGWLLALVIAFILARRARKEREALGIQLHKAPSPAPG